MAVSLRGTVTTATFGSNNNGNLTVNKPTGVVDGDLLYLFVQTSNAGKTATTPAGWTLASSDVTAGGASYVFRKTAASEGSSFAVAISAGGGNTSAIGACVAFYDTSGAGNPKEDVLTKVVDVSADTTADNTGVTPTFAPGGMLLAFIGIGSVATSLSGYAVVTSNPTWTEQVDTNTNFGGETCSLAVATAPRDLTTATGNFSATIADSSMTAVYLINVQPAGFLVASPLAAMTLSPFAAAFSLAITFTSTLASMAFSGKAATFTTADPKWGNTSKHASTATNTTKHASTATNTSKNTSTWANTSKTP